MVRDVRNWVAVGRYEAVSVTCALLSFASTASGQAQPGDSPRGSVAESTESTSSEPPTELSTPTTDQGASSASAAFWAANEAYSEQRYAEAIELYEHAHAQSGEAALLFNIAQCHRLMGDCRSANRAYARYLAEERTPPESARSWLVQLQAECSDDTTPEPTKEPSQLGAGPKDAGDLQGAGGYPEPTADTLTPRPYWTRDTTVGWSLVAAGVASAGVATWFGFEVRDAESRAQRATVSTIDSGERWGSEQEGIEQDGVRYARLATGFGVAAVVLSGVGIGWLLLEPTDVWANEAANGREGFAIVADPIGQTGGRVTWKAKF